MPINVVITCDTPEEVTQAVQMRDQLHRMCDEPLTVKLAVGIVLVLAGLSFVSL